MRGHAEGVGDGGFAAEHQGAERGGGEARAEGGLDFGGGEIAFGADEPEDAAGGAAEGGGGVGKKRLQRLGAGVKAGNELEIIIAGAGADSVVRGEEGDERLQRGDIEEPGIAALFGGFEGGGAPFLDFFVLTVAVEVDLGAFADDGDDAGGTDFGGFADDIVETGAFRKGLGERDGVGKGRGPVSVANGENGGVFGVGG